MQRHALLVGAVVVDKGCVLLVRRSEKERFMPGAWGIPAGKVNYGEDLEDAVLRELAEETSLGGVVDRTAGSSWFMSTRKNESMSNVQVNFIVKPNDRDVVLDSSSQAYAWVPVDEVLTGSTAEDTLKGELDDFTKQTILRALEGNRSIAAH